MQMDSQWWATRTKHRDGRKNTDSRVGIVAKGEIGTIYELRALEGLAHQYAANQQLGSACYKQQYWLLN